MKVIYSIFVIFSISMSAQAQLRFDKKLLDLNGISDQQVEDAIHDREFYPGENSVYLYVNDQFIAETVIFAVDGGQAGYMAHDLKTFGLKKEAWGQRIEKGTRTYVQLTDRIRQDFSRSDRSLLLTVPRALLENPDFIQHKKGGAGVFVNYNAYYSTLTSTGSGSESLNTIYQIGANVDSTLLRANGSFSSFTSKTQRHLKNNVQSFYVDRDFDFGHLKAGRLNSPDGGFGVGYLDGIVYTTKGVPSGIGSVVFAYDSDTPAVIEFYQRNQLVYTSNVIRGHNNLGSVPVTSLTSDVLVVVKRNGQVIDTRHISRARISRVPTQSSGFYTFAGRSNTESHAMLVGAGYSKYYSDVVSFASSAIAQQHYQGVSISNTFNRDGLRMTTYGVLSRNERNDLGANFSATLSCGKTDLTYQAISRNFTYVGQALHDNQANVKSTYGITHSFVTGDRGALDISLNYYGFYDRASHLEWSAGYSTNIKKALLTLSSGYAPHVPGDNSFNKMTLNARLSIPLDVGGRRIYHRTQYNAYGSTQRLDDYLTARVSSDFNVTAGRLRRKDGRTDSAGSYIGSDVNTPYTYASLNVSNSESKGNSTTSRSLSLSGSIVATHKGVVFAPRQIRETYAIVDTHLKDFIKVSSRHGSATTNHNGKAVMTNISDVQPDFVKVIPEGLGDGVFFQNNQVDFVSDRGAVSHFEFEPTYNSTLLLHWVNKPEELGSRTVFYGWDGNLIASFIDQNVLLIKQEYIEQLRTSGMFDASNRALNCILTNQLDISNEQIIDATFDCAQ